MAEHGPVQHESHAPADMGGSGGAHSGKIGEAATGLVDAIIVPAMVELPQKAILDVGEKFPPGADGGAAH